MNQMWMMSTNQMNLKKPKRLENRWTYSHGSAQAIYEASISIVELDSEGEWYNITT